MNWFKNFVEKIIQPKNEEKIQLIDEDYWLFLEEQLLRADCGIPLTDSIINALKAEYKKQKLTVQQLQEVLIKYLTDILNNTGNSKEIKNINNKNKLNIKFVMGVNGAGKTTSIGKLAYYYKNLNNKLMIIPCDTFRAGASDQVSIWADRANVELFEPSNIKHKANAILFEAIQKAIQEQDYNILLVDTAGRLQNKKELMDELSSLSKVLDKYTDISSQRLLVLDATTGQNGLRQAMVFKEACELDGIILTKFDGSSKGGIIFAIAYQLNISVQFLGIGEKIHELEVFNPREFAKAFLTK